MLPHINIKKKKKHKQMTRKKKRKERANEVMNNTY